MATLNELESAICELEKGKEYNEGEIEKVRKSLSNSATFISGYNARTFQERLDRLNKRKAALFTVSVSKEEVCEARKVCETRKVRETREAMVDTENESVSNVQVADLTDHVLNVPRMVDSVFLKHLTRSSIRVGPCSGAAYLEDVNDGEAHIAAHQIRLYKCKNIQLYAYTLTSIALECCENIIILPLSEWYEGMKDDMNKAGLVGESRHKDVMDFSSL